MTWEQVLTNPFLQNLPFKIQLNRFGQVLMGLVTDKKQASISLKTGNGRNPNWRPN